MELWIRSQDKSSIVKVDNLYVSVGNYICYYVEKGKEVPDTYYRPSGELGRYKTKERTLEILDEIQEAQLGNYHYRCPSNVKVSNNENTIVYEMPKE